MQYWEDKVFTEKTENVRYVKWSERYVTTESTQLKTNFHISTNCSKKLLRCKKMKASLPELYVTKLKMKNAIEFVFYALYRKKKRDIHKQEAKKLGRVRFQLIVLFNHDILN